MKLLRARRHECQSINWHVLMNATNRRTACELIASIQESVHALATRTPHSGAELHAFCEAVARPLGLYGDGPAITEIMASIDLLDAAVRDAKGAITTPDNSTRAQTVELSAQSGQLVASAAGVQAAGASASRNLTCLPYSLWTGVLAGKEPQNNSDDAIAILDAICSALEHLSQSLNLECFMERTEAGEKTHTFTSGGKIFVIDVELGLSGEEYKPVVGLKLSYAHDDISQNAPGGAPGDTRLADMLRTHLYELACVLHGTSDSQVPYVRASSLWALVASSLTTLAYIDELNAKTSGSHDLFGSLATLGTAAESVAIHEANALGFSISLNDIRRSDVLTKLARQGHGAAMLHVNVPYLELVYHVPVNGDHHSAIVSVSPTTLPEAYRIQPVELLGGPDSALADALADRLNTTCGDRRVCFVARLNPPVIVPHRTLRSLWQACGLEVEADKTPVNDTSTKDSYLSARLGSVANEPGKVVFIPGKQDEERRIVSILPFECLLQLYAAIEILHSDARIGELLDNAQSNPGPGSLPVTLELNNCAGLRLSFVSRKSESHTITATILPTRDTWSISAQSGDKQLDENTAAALAANLTTTASLASMVNALHEWL